MASQSAGSLSPRTSGEKGTTVSYGDRGGEEYGGDKK